jgi:hypothetical protein
LRRSSRVAVTMAESSQMRTDGAGGPPIATNDVPHSATHA